MLDLFRTQGAAASAGSCYSLSPPISRAVWGEFLRRPSHPHLKLLRVRFFCLSYFCKCQELTHRDQMRNIKVSVASLQWTSRWGRKLVRILYFCMGLFCSLDIIWVCLLRVHVFGPWTPGVWLKGSKLLRSGPWWRWSRSGSVFETSSLCSHENKLQEQAQSLNSSLASCLSMRLFSCVLSRIKSLHWCWSLGLSDLGHSTSRTEIEIALFLITLPSLRHFLAVMKTEIILSSTWS